MDHKIFSTKFSKVHSLLKKIKILFILGTTHRHTWNKEIINSYESWLEMKENLRYIYCISYMVRYEDRISILIMHLITYDK